MTIAGWITLIVSVSGVTALFVWCIYKVLTSPPRDHELAHVEPIEESKAEER
jgi:hypothetical protein